MNFFYANKSIGKGDLFWALLNLLHEPIQMDPSGLNISFHHISLTYPAYSTCRGSSSTYPTCPRASPAPLTRRMSRSYSASSWRMSRSCSGCLSSYQTVLYLISSIMMRGLRVGKDSVRHIPWTELYVRSTLVLCKKNLYYKLSEDGKLLRLENGYIETFLWKRNGQKWCFLLFLMQF